MSFPGLARAQEMRERRDLNERFAEGALRIISSLEVVYVGKKSVYFNA